MIYGFENEMVKSDTESLFPELLFILEVPRAELLGVTLLRMKRQKLLFKTQKQKPAHFGYCCHHNVSYIIRPPLQIACQVGSV